MASGVISILTPSAFQVQLAIQLAPARGWSATTGDVKPAFLNGISASLSRKLPVWELCLIPHGVSLVMGEGVGGGGGGGCQFWLGFAAALHRRADFQVVAQEAFS